jgi:hypothetical protein
MGEALSPSPSVAKLKKKRKKKKINFVALLSVVVHT